MSYIARPINVFKIRAFDFTYELLMSQHRRYMYKRDPYLLCFVKKENWNLNLCLYYFCGKSTKSSLPILQYCRLGYCNFTHRVSPGQSRTIVNTWKMDDLLLLFYFLSIQVPGVERGYVSLNKSYVNLGRIYFLGFNNTIFLLKFSLRLFLYDKMIIHSFKVQKGLAFEIIQPLRCKHPPLFCNFT